MTLQSMNEVHSSKYLVSMHTVVDCIMIKNRPTNMTTFFYLLHELLLKAVHHVLVTGAAVVNLFYQILHSSADVIYA